MTEKNKNIAEYGHFKRNLDPKMTIKYKIWILILIQCL